jgi:hypothetical protein
LGVIRTLINKNDGFAIAVMNGTGPIDVNGEVQSIQPQIAI